MKASTKWTHALDLGIVAYAIVIVLGFNLLPTFAYAIGVQKSPDCRPFDLILKFDKLLLGCLVLWALKYKNRRVDRQSLAKLGWLTLGCTAVLMITALSVGYVRFDPGITELSWLWVTINLALVSFGEEAFFRCFLIEKLQGQRVVKFNRLGLTIATSLLFGFAHYRGGPPYIVLSTIAGLFYGRAYCTAGLKGAVAIHFLVNFIHYIGFSYPALVRG